MKPIKRQRRSKPLRRCRCRLSAKERPPGGCEECQWYRPDEDDPRLRVLFLEPFYGGSHRAFADGWRDNSRHTFTILGLPDRKWKWRMRHAAVEFATDVNHRIDAGEQWDVLICSDMLNLAEFIGLTEGRLRKIPTVVYFHENQLTYPVRDERERDMHFAFTNMTTALCADAVWFNSHYHKDACLQAMDEFVKRMPDYRPSESVRSIEPKSSVHPPCITPPTRAIQTRSDGPLHIVWASRWEHDKNPEDFFAALDSLQSDGVDFEVSVLGQHYDETPKVFETARKSLGSRVRHWGFVETRHAYHKVLSQADIVVSTAHHEFFGLAVIEAIAAGAFPVLPKRLSYPEILMLESTEESQMYFYDGTVKGLAEKLTSFASAPECLREKAGPARTMVEDYYWERGARLMDQSLERLVASATSLK